MKEVTDLKVEFRPYLVVRRWLLSHRLDEHTATVMDQPPHRTPVYDLAQLGEINLGPMAVGKGDFSWSLNGATKAHCDYTGRRVGYWDEDDTPHPPDAAAVKNCSCGIYALNDIEGSGMSPYFTKPTQGSQGWTRRGTRMESYPWAMEIQLSGAIRVWGRVQVHEDGVRAEYAQPIAFMYQRIRPDIDLSVQGNKEWLYGAYLVDRLINNCAYPVRLVHTPHELEGVRYEHWRARGGDSGSAGGGSEGRAARYPGEGARARQGPFVIE